MYGKEHPSQHNVFQSPIWGFILNTEQYHAIDYIDTIMKMKETMPSQVKSNMGGWQSDDNLHSHGIFREFASIIRKLSSEILESYTKREVYVQSMWANVNHKYNMNMAHTHEGELSGVFYLKIPPDSGRLILVNPMIRSEMKVIREKNYSIEPENLACIMFPSWMEHYVEMNQSDEDRISISFNIGVR